MKRLLFIHQNYVSSQETGNSRAERTVHCFLKSGWTVDLITSSLTYLGRERQIDDKVAGLNVHFIDCNYQNNLEKKGSSYWSFIKESFTICKNLENFDLIFSSSPPLPQVVVGIYASFRFKCPVLGEVRDLWPLFIEEQLNSRLLSFTLRFLELLYFNHSSKLISVSPGFSPYFKALGISSDKIEIVPSGVQLNVPSWKGLKNVDRRNDGCFKIVYAGSLNEAYDLDELVAAILELREEGEDISLTIYGEGRNREKYKSLSQIEDRINFKESLPREELLKVLHLYDAAVNVHSDWEYLGSTITGKLMDYLAVGIPVLNITQGIMTFIIEDCEGGINSESNKHSLKEAIAKLYNSDNKQEGPGNLRKHSWLRKFFSSEYWNSVLVETAEEIDKTSFSPRTRILSSLYLSIAGLVSSRPQKASYALKKALKDGTINEQYEEWKKSLP